MSKGVQFFRNEVALEVRADNLPPGIAGRITGIALRYDVVDTYETTFARGCLKRSIDERVAARKVPLLMDHERTTGAHVGIVTGMADMETGVAMTADVFDTPEGRACMEYVRAVIAAGASTGLSIGFVPIKSQMASVEGRMVQRFTEVALREVSVTPMPSVPGTEVTSARHEDTSDDVTRSDDELLYLAAEIALVGLSPALRSKLLEQYQTRTEAPVAAAADATLPDASLSLAVPMADRLAAVRATYMEAR